MAGQEGQIKTLLVYGAVLVRPIGQSMGCQGLQSTQAKSRSVLGVQVERRAIPEALPAETSPWLAMHLSYGHDPPDSG